MENDIFRKLTPIYRSCLRKILCGMIKARARELLANMRSVVDLVYVQLLAVDRIGNALTESGLGGPDSYVSLRCGNKIDVGGTQQTVKAGVRRIRAVVGL